jgi:hypothetical protein
MGGCNLIAGAAIVVVLPAYGEIMLFVAIEIGSSHRNFDHAPICRHIRHMHLLGFGLKSSLCRGQRKGAASVVSEHRCSDGNQ